MKWSLSCIILQDGRVWQRRLQRLPVFPNLSKLITRFWSLQQVSSGRTGHKEAMQVKFDPKVVTYEQLLTSPVASADASFGCSSR